MYHNLVLLHNIADVLQLLPDLQVCNFHVLCSLRAWLNYTWIHGV